MSWSFLCWIITLSPVDHSKNKINNLYDYSLFYIFYHFLWGISDKVMLGHCRLSGGWNIADGVVPCIDGFPALLAQKEGTDDNEEPSNL